MKKTNNPNISSIEKKETPLEVVGMNQATTENLNKLVNFLDGYTTFSYSLNGGEVNIVQKEDKKCLRFYTENIDKIIERKDLDGSIFIQINFKDDSKALLTQHLVGFKPLQVNGVDLSKIPKVVTTVDLKSVVLAIQDLIEVSLEGLNNDSELEIMKKVYQSIIQGAEAIGFNMILEKDWYIRNLLNSKAAAA